MNYHPKVFTLKKSKMFFTGLASGSANPNSDNIWSSSNDGNLIGSNQATIRAEDSAWFHQSSGSSAVNLPVDSRPLCRYFLNGHCSSGSSCAFSHQFGSLEFPQDRYICEICSDDIIGNGGRFGLLENCDHVFCLNCIREWRNQREKQDRENLRKCPICRVDSFIIIPSTRFLCGIEKMEERQRYRASVSEIPCKNFNYGKGKCQFGTSCMYMHLQEDDNGSVKRPAAPVYEFKMIQGAEGKKTKKQTQLADFVKLS